MNKTYNNIEIKLENAYLSGFEAMAALVDAKDFYTGEHSKNVSKYVSIICNNLSCSKNKEDSKNKVKIAATFHDLGKIGVPDNILKNPGKLSNSDYEIMKTHPIIGANVIDKIEGFSEISTIIRHHHERWDGAGYPDGLKGNEIPFGSQIISIADTFDAITSDRVYRKGRSEDIAIKILTNEKGKQFNPELVDIFIKSISIPRY
ncbi:HD domain-containing protein [Clostridium algoriphilum]|uniref:HD-GYP domain-containing protein n=1 Tax=Clostridium algoriphilum TaxID=198347 RepID=UPI001CF5CD3F|nr:HD domain-containing phosphohydrolase [Clostridium algoriphilum]MCB2293506.1 HD domain-containing protein [Clostridium algoriphilum]